MTIQAAQQQINAILAGCTTASSINEFTNQTKRKHDVFFLLKMADCTVPIAPSSAPTYANDNHDAFLHHQQNNANKNTSTICPGKNKPTLIANSNTVAHTLTEIPVRDERYVTHTLKTLCTLNTRSSDPTYNDTDAILNIMIWNQPILQYQMPIQPFTPIHNRSRQPSTAIRYALIGVHDKLLNPPKLPCPLSLFTSITCVVLSCFILLADSFIMVKINDQYPDKRFD